MDYAARPSMQSFSAARGETARWAALVLVVALSGCYAAHERSGEGGLDPLDGGGLDGGGRDGGAGEDAAVGEDAGPIEVDAGTIDAGFLDGGRRDAGRFDGGLPIDSGRPDSGSPSEAGLPFDGGPRDAGVDGGGRRSIALRFRGDQWVSIPDRPGLSVGPDTTYEMWIRAYGPGILSRKGFDEGVQHHAIRLERAADGAMHIAAGWTVGGGERREVRAPFDAHLGRWTHVALVIQRAGRRLRILLYVDFVELGRTEVDDDIADAYSLEPLALGRFDGDLDEVRLWGSVRDAETLRANAFMRLRSGTTGLVAYWPLEEAPSQFVLDRSLRGNDGVLGSSTSIDDSDPVWITDGAIP